MEEKSYKEVIKATGAIHIAHDLTLLQQQTWNVLLAHAFPNLENQDIFQISENTFFNYFPFETRNTNHFKEILRVLNTTQVEYNILRKDKKSWGVFTLLAGAELKDGIITYGYYGKLKQLLNNPAVYAKISLLTQSRFKSKYSLFLYELCMDYKGVEQTPWIEVDQFRKFMGIKPHEYTEFKDLNKKIIQIPLKEINKKSDLALAVQFQKEEKKIVALKFVIEQNQLTLSLSIPESSTVQQLLNLGVSSRQTKTLTQQYTKERLERAIRILKIQGKKVKNVGGFLKKALEEAWEHKEFIPEQKKKTEIDALQWFAQQDQNTRSVIFAQFQKEYPQATSKTHPQAWEEHLKSIQREQITAISEE